MPLSTGQARKVFGRSRETAWLRHLPLLIVAVVQLACGGAGDLDTERAVDRGEPERFANYPVEGPGYATPCGWLPMPNGQTDYVPCPSAEARSPISDPPDQEYDDLLGPVVDPRPDPPGDPPPL